MGKKQVTYHTLLIVTVLFTCLNFTGGTEKTTNTKPEFVSLLEGETNFYGTIYDEKNIIPVYQISFTGHTKIGGIRRESDDSINILDLAKIQELEILKENYISPRYQDKEYILAKTISSNGYVTKDLLIPRNIVICAISTKTDMAKSWYLKKINKIKINKKEENPNNTNFKNSNKSAESNQQEKETFLQKIKRGISNARQAIKV